MFIVVDGVLNLRYDRGVCSVGKKFTRETQWKVLL